MADQDDDDTPTDGDRLLALFDEVETELQAGLKEGEGYLHTKLIDAIVDRVDAAILRWCCYKVVERMYWCRSEEQHRGYDDEPEPTIPERLKKAISALHDASEELETVNHKIGMVADPFGAEQVAEAVINAPLRREENRRAKAMVEALFGLRPREE